MDTRRVRDETFVRSVEHRLTVDSTNSLALRMIEDSPELPLLVVADEQTAGRGRGANSWWSPVGCLMFSLVIRRLEQEERLPPYSLHMGLAVRAALAEIAPSTEVAVKWPNDVYLDQRKVSGILVEVPPAGADTLVIGVGINVNSSFQDAPSSVSRVGTSLYDATGSTFDPLNVLCRVLRHVERELDLVQRESGLAERWLPVCYLLNRRVALESGGRTVSGVCAGIDDSGGLLLATDSGVQTISSGVVSFAE